MRNLIFLFMIFLVACQPKTRNLKTDIYNEPNGLVLENNHLKMIFDSGNGAILSFTNKQTGWHIQKRSELALSFELLVPAPEKRNNPIVGIKQKLKSEVISDDKQCITFTWENLLSERAGVVLRGAELTALGYESTEVFHAQTRQSYPPSSTVPL